MGFLKKLADKKYLIKYNVSPANGKARQQKTETLKGVTKKQAEAILAQRKAQVTSRTYIQEQINVSMLFEHFMAAKNAGNRAPTTLARYGTLYTTYIKPAFGTMLLKNLDQHHLTDAYSRWSLKGKSGHPLSPRTVRHIHDLMRGMLNYAVRKGKVSRNIATLVSEDLPRAVKPSSVALTEEELRHLLECANQPTAWAKKRGVVSAQGWFAPAVWFAAFTGARRGETLAVRWRDLNLDEGTALICRSLTQTEIGLAFKAPKNGSSRSITLPASLVHVLREHRARQESERASLGEAYRGEGLVFAMPDGRPVLPWTFTASFRYLVERSKVQYIRLHDLRDTHASLLAKHGIPLEVVSRRLGHSGIGITAERYLHVYQSSDAQAAMVFERLASYQPEAF
jgi:integrase